MSIHIVSAYEASMNERQARQLAAEVPLEYKTRVRRIGNGEYVVIANDVYLWSPEDLVLLVVGVLTEKEYHRGNGTTHRRRN